MSIKYCFKKAKERYNKGLVKTIRISFVCFRSNELVSKGINRKKAMKKANLEYRNYKNKKLR